MLPRFSARKGIPAAGGLFRLSGFFLMVSLLCFAPRPALGADVVYNGATPPLQNIDGIWGGTIPPGSYALLPGPINSPGLDAGNTVTIDYTAGNNPDYVYGGLSQAGTVQGNAVRMNNGRVSANVSGGYSETGQVRNNAVTIAGGKVDGAVHGGFSVASDALDNSVTISGGTADSVFGGRTFIGGEASGNRVNIFGGQVTGGVLGGDGSTGALRNTVFIGGGEVNGNVIAGQSSNGDASYNTVIMTGGSVSGFINGGDAQTSPLGKNASNNTISIVAGRVESTIVGGISAGTGKAVNNTVNIFPGASLNPTATTLYGGFLQGLPLGDAFSGNTLNVYAWSGSLAGIRGFESYNILLPNNISPARPQIAVLNPVDLTGTTVTVNGILAGGKLSPVGETLILIDRVSGTPAALQARQVPKGLGLVYDLDLDVSGGALTATVRSIQANPRLKAVSEGRLAGSVLLGQGADLLVGRGLDAAAAGQRGVVPFAAGQGGTARYNTGSHLDVDGFSLLTGLALNTPVATGTLTVGAFFEAGWSNYDSRNSFNGYASVKGNGDASYQGGGLLARFTLPWSATGRLYAEGSGRAGRVKSDFTSGDLYSVEGRAADYDTGSTYYGGHAGLGCLLDLSETVRVDLSAKYILTRQESDSVTLESGDPVRFKTADSQRWRSGARLSLALNEYITPYLGAYYDYECDGKARASVYGYGIDAPDVTGGTGVGELGLSIRPGDGGLSLNLGIQGYTGVREGVTGSAQVQFVF